MKQVIYIPGLGDSRVTGQRLAVSTWWLYGVHPHLFQINWADSQPYQVKFDRLLGLIDALNRKGPVYIVAASAGAMVAVSAYYQRSDKVHGVVCIAGVLQYFRATPPASSDHSSFAAASYLAGQALPQLNTQQRRKIMSVRGQTDRVVAPQTSLVAGAHNVQVSLNGHAKTIASQLVFGAPKFLRFLKKLD